MIERLMSSKKLSAYGRQPRDDVQKEKRSAESDRKATERKGKLFSKSMGVSARFPKLAGISIKILDIITP